jgi:uncharacterized protein YjiS (DUF1127 family)
MSKLPNTPATSEALADFIGLILDETRSALRRAAARRRNRRLLQHLPDRQLRDIGLSRDSLPATFLNPVRRYHSDL